MNILDKIIARKKEEIAFFKSKISIDELKNTDFFGRKTYSLKESVKSRNGIIAEFKRQSPSKGIINHQQNEYIRQNNSKERRRNCFLKK